MAKLKTHYAGKIIWGGGSVLPGWAACCSGGKAIDIADRGNHSYDRQEVTCKACKKMIQKHDDFAPRYAKILEERRRKIRETKS